MRQIHSTLFALVLALGPLACAAPMAQERPAFEEFAPHSPPTRTAAKASSEADAVVEGYYRDDSGKDATPVIEAALKKSPDHPGLHEIAGYQALLRGDPHAAFDHFYSVALDKGATVPELALWEMSLAAQTVTEHLREKALLDLLSKTHEDANVRAAATYMLTREMRLFDEDPSAQIDSLGLIGAWRVIGPFDNDQGRGATIAYAPETSVDRAHAVPGLLGSVQFRPITLDRGSVMFDLEESVHAGEAVAYLETSVVTTAPRSLELRLTTDSAVRAWVNGKLALSEEKFSSDELDNIVAKIELPAGPSRLLIKTGHRTGAWHFTARLTEVGGGKATGLRFETPSTDAPPIALDPKPTQSTTWRSLDRMSDVNRKRFLLGRLALRNGNTRDPVNHFEPFLASAPHNPLAIYYTATAYWDLGESGKALDLLNRGVTAYSFAPGFLVKRGRFYYQKRLWDKARADLEAALVKAPNAREAETLLAAVDSSRGWALDRCAVLEQSLSKWPDSPRMLVDLGSCSESRGEYGAALAKYRRAVAIMPGFQPALNELLDNARRRPDEAESLSLIRRLRKLAPSSVSYAIEEADVLHQFGHAAEAQRVLDRLASDSPDSPRPLEHLGDYAFEAHDHARAIAYYRSALERDPQDTRLAERLDALAPETRSLADRLAASDDDIEHAIDSADKIVVNPGSHYAVLLDDDVTQVNADGSSKRLVTIVRKVLNENGRDALIQAKLPGFGRVKVVDAYSMKRGGERQEASSVTGSLVRFRSLDVGSIVVLRYVHYAPGGRFLPNEYASQWTFQSVNAQTEKARYRLVLSKGRDLSVAIQGDVKSATETVEGQDVHTFTAVNVPPLVAEPGMPSSQDTLAMVSVSTLKDWGPYVSWERALLTDAKTDNEEIRALAKKLTADAPTPREKLDKLWSYVAQEIRYQQEYEDTIAGVKPHPPRVVIERGYGDCKDKAMLLSDLARSVGIELRFAILRTTPFGKVAKNIPNQQFNHAIDYVPQQPGFDQSFFLDSTTNGLDLGNLRGDDQGAMSLVLSPNDKGFEFLEIPYQPTNLEYERHKLEVDLRDPSKAHAVDRLELRGSSAAYLRTSVRSEDIARKVYQSLSEHVFSGTTLISGKSDHAQDITRPLVVDLETDVTNTVQEDAADLRFPIPLQFPLSQAAVLASRKLPLVLERGELSSEVAIDLPSAASRKPQSFSVENPCFTYARHVDGKGSRLTITTTYKSSCARVEPADYAAFRAAVQKVLAHAQDSATFPAPPASVGHAPPKKP